MCYTHRWILRGSYRLISDRTRGIWPYRLSVRSSGFHPGKSGSIPGGATEQVLEIGYGFLNWTEGEMAEWSIAAVLKTVVLKGTGGSNPSFSAEQDLEIGYG